MGQWGSLLSSSGICPPLTFRPAMTPFKNKMWELYFKTKCFGFILHHGYITNIRRRNLEKGTKRLKKKKLDDNSQSFTLERWHRLYLSRRKKRTRLHRSLRRSSNSRTRGMHLKIKERLIITATNRNSNRRSNWKQPNIENKYRKKNKCVDTSNNKQITWAKQRKGKPKRETETFLKNCITKQWQEN